MKMVDTIILTLKQDMFTILEPDKFSPSASGLLNADYRLGGRSNSKCVQNPTPRELKAGVYKPRLTLTKRVNKNHNYETTLKIEFSISKLLFGNNFDELENEDFFDTVLVLQQKLKDMGVEVNEVVLALAPVSGIHFSKNIVLTDGSIPYSYLKEIQKTNISQRLDFNQTDYANEGHSVKFRTNTYEIAFYDKLKELQKAKVSDKRTEEKDNSIQLKLFEKVKIKTPFEVLRMELRLNNRQKIKQLIKKLGLKNNPTFISLVNKSVAIKMLLYHLDLIEENYPKVLYFKTDSPEDFVAQFLIDNPTATIKDAFGALGFAGAVQKRGVREIRQLLKNFPKSKWYTFQKYLNKFKYTKNSFSVFEPIRNQINEFKPLKLVDFKDEMANTGSEEVMK